MKMDFLQRLVAFAEAEGFEISGFEDLCGNCEGIRCSVRDLKVSFRRREPWLDPKHQAQRAECPSS
jgi:hypothetical protein